MPIAIKLSDLLIDSPATVAAGAALWTHRSHIYGLRLGWVADDSISVSSGSAYIPSIGYAIEVPSEIILSGLVLAGNSQFHAYLYVDTIPRIELSADAPDDPYIGTARTKPSDISKRYIGSIFTAPDGSIVRFVQADDSIWYVSDLSDNPFLLVDGKRDAVEREIILNGIVPPTAQSAFFSMRVDADDPGCDATLAPIHGMSILTARSPRESVYAQFPLVSGSVYINLTAEIEDGHGDGATLAVCGYTFGR